MNSVSGLWKDVWFLIPNWKWLMLMIAALSGLLLQKGLRLFLAKFKMHPRFHKAHAWLHHFLNLSVESAAAWLGAIFLWHFSLDALALGGALDKYLGLTVHLFQAVILIRLTYFAVEAFGFWIDELVKKTENTLDDQLAPLATKTLKIFVVIFGALIVMQSFNVNVMSLLAGLGLGGLALALAAQDTAANLFGSITIILDRPFQINDWIKVGETEGTVEEIGFRSTRIRTFYNSLVTVPNSIMAKERIDNLGARGAGRIRHLLGVTYDTPTETLRKFIERIRYNLIQNPDVDPERIRVVFNQFGDFSLQILVQCHVKTIDVQQELEIQEEILMDIKDIAREMNVEFAFPTQTLHMAPTLQPAPREMRPL